MHPLNIDFISVTYSVLKLAKLIVLRDSQLLNISFMLVTFFVSSFSKLAIFSKDLHLSNILSIDLASDVLIFSKFTDEREVQPLNIFAKLS